MSVLCGTICVSIISLILYAWKKPEPKKIFGVYAVPGKWYYLKYAVFACIYYYRKYAKRNSAAGTDGRAGQGVKAIADPADMERAQQLSDHPKAFDAIFFIGAVKAVDGQSLFVTVGCERRPMGICNSPIYISVPGKGLLCGKKIPDTVMFGANIAEFGAEGLKFTPVKPMDTWTISYKGQMWYQNDPSKLVDVEFQAEWKATSKYFDFDSDLYGPVIIRSIAQETWSREYFEALKTAHQSHYEQFGAMKCKVKVENQTHEYTMPAFRDHSFGHKRDWCLMYRYCFHHIFLENGVSMSVGVICQPSTASVMEMGVVALANGDVLPAKWVDIKLYAHGEGGTPPKDYAFQFQAGDQVYTVQVLVETESTHYVTPEWECRMVERFCKYKVNDIPGLGVSEFQYNHKGGRPESYAKNDPEWFRKIKSTS